MGTDHHHHHYHHHHYHEDVGRADRPSPNPHRLTRSRTNRILCGVCGGLAEYLGWKPLHVRLLAILGLILFHPATIGAYIVGCFVMKRAPLGPRGGGRTDADEQFWRDVSTRPSETFSQTEAHVPRPRGAHRENGARRDHRGVPSQARLPRDRGRAQGAELVSRL